MHRSPDKPSLYVGRFAPSPTGPLHFGSLVCALASYLDAKSHGGQWLLRIEDIDPPREEPGAADAILRSLEEHGLLWDGEPLWQSTRLDVYNDYLEHLRQEGWLYDCHCTRGRIAQLNGVYDGRCRNANHDKNQATAKRINLSHSPSLATTILFNDRVVGLQEEHLEQDVGDFILRRKDGLFAYQLAVVVDDIYQGITHIVRGRDLLDSTGRQLFLLQVLDSHIPEYAHIPVIVDRQANKLSKQNHARAITHNETLKNVWWALNVLGLQPSVSLMNTSIDEIIRWATLQWDIKKIPKTNTCILPQELETSF